MHRMFSAARPLHLLDVGMVGVLTAFSGQAAGQAVEQIAHVVPPALVEGIGTADAGLQPVDGPPQPANQRTAPARGCCFGHRLLSADGHHDDICLMGQRQQRISVFRGQGMKCLFPPLFHGDVQAEQVGIHLRHQRHQRCQIGEYGRFVKLCQGAENGNPGLRVGLLYVIRCHGLMIVRLRRDRYGESAVKGLGEIT